MSEVKKSAGDQAIESARAGTASNKTFVKALWSIRGTLLCTVAGFAYPVAVERSSLVRTLQALPGDDHAGLTLTGQGTEWVLHVGTAPAPAKAKAKARTRAKAKPDADPAPQGTEEPATE
jgi:hypothetical protein